MSDPLVTFIIPTIGRKTLEDTIRSLQAQTDPNWRAIIVADGIMRIRLNKKLRDDRRIRVHYAPLYNSAGLTRNVGIQEALYADQSNWIAFVDDDDTLDARYVALLDVYDKGPDHLDVVVFRADWPDGMVLPDIDNPRLEWGHVGISYAVRSEWFEESADLPPIKHRFIKESNLETGGVGSNEDITLLKDLINDGAAVTICPYLCYHVRPNETVSK